MDFDKVEQTYRKWLWLDDDPQILKLLFAAVLANRWRSDPVWMMMVGTSGVGKTELIRSLATVPGHVSVSSLTAFGLASGHETENSLLFQLGERAMLLIEDMSGITEVKADRRGLLMAFLRQAYGGEFRRYTGKAQVEWSGKFGIIAGTTPAGEYRTESMAQLGERFLTVRPRRSKAGSEKVLDAAQASAANKLAMRADLQMVAERYLATEPDVEATSIKNRVNDYAKAAARLIAALRTVPMRNSYTREIDMPLDPQETPLRLYTQLICLTLAFKHMGIEADEQIQLLKRIMVDSVPLRRMVVLQQLSRLGERATAKELRRTCRMGERSIRQQLEEMQHLRVIAPSRGGRGGYEVKAGLLREALLEDHAGLGEE